MTEAVITFEDVQNPDPSKIIKIVHIAGQLDESNVDQKVQEIYQLLEQNPQNLSLIIDLSNLDYMNSKSIGYLTDIYGKITESGGKIAIAQAKANIIDILQVVGLTQLINTFTSIEEAKADFLAMSPAATTAPTAPPTTPSVTPAPPVIETPIPAQAPSTPMPETQPTQPQPLPESIPTQPTIPSQQQQTAPPPAPAMETPAPAETLQTTQENTIPAAPIAPVAPPPAPQPIQQATEPTSPAQPATPISIQYPDQNSQPPSEEPGTYQFGQ